MNELAIKNFTINDERESHIWNDCLFVFDTSALLDLYFFTKKSQDKIFDNVFSKVNGRLWVPQHVEFEYLKNRKLAIKKPIKEKYESLNENVINKIKSNTVLVGKLIDELGKKTIKDEVHPYIDNALVKTLKESFDVFKNEYQLVESKIDAEIKERINEVNDYSENDIVFERISSIFNVGREFSFKEIMEVVQEGKIRYENKIAPGYMDGVGSNAKDGTQKYGDLIIWKQIIEQAKDSSKAIVFITNDVKDDWCYKEKRSNELRIERPKEDLVKEIKDEANVDFWMYTFSQFLYKSNRYIGSLITEDVLEEAKDHNKIKIRTDGLYYETSSDKSYRSYLGFTENGKVFSASVVISDDSVEDDAKQIISWLVSEKEDSGTYDIVGNKISFTCISDYGSVDYKGTVNGETLILDCHSHINDNVTLSRVYKFAQVENS
ncbi:TPA: DUF4935 domain-containing protein [Vibrio parahaemolyticus]|nr:PIN domain-containing protein [Vibrio parahaemolyticus]HCH5065421.1 DUF4935 domain-containing protein [Vibrio parahaemolyticus]